MRILWCAKKQLDVSLDRETWIAMTRALQARGHEVRLVTSFRKRPDDFGLGNAIVYVKTKKSPGLLHLSFLVGCLATLDSAFKKWRPDVVVVDYHSAPAAMLLRILASRRGDTPPLVLDVRTLPVAVTPHRRAAEQLMFSSAVLMAGRLCDGMTTISEPLAVAVAKLAHVQRVRVGVWTSGVDLARFDPVRFGDGAKNLMPRSEFTLLYHGALILERGLGELLQAVAIVHRKGIAVKLVLLGSGVHKTVLTRMVSDFGLEGVVAVLPPVPPEDIPSAIYAADAGIIPFPDLVCWRVSSPLKLLEYLAMCRPVIATRIACNVSVVGNADYVVWADSARSAALASAIETAARTRDELREAALAGRALVEKRFTWDTQAELFEKYLMGITRCAR